VAAWLSGGSGGAMETEEITPVARAVSGCYAAASLDS
jgi:hypothetical protein